MPLASCRHNLRLLFMVASLLVFLAYLPPSYEGVSVTVFSGELSLMNEMESQVSELASVSLRGCSGTDSGLAKGVDVANGTLVVVVAADAGVDVCFESVFLMISPLSLVIVSLLIMNTFEFSSILPFSNVITLRTGEFCTKIFVLGMLWPPLLELVVTCSVMELLLFELGSPLPGYDISSSMRLGVLARCRCACACACASATRARIA